MKSCARLVFLCLVLCAASSCVKAQQKIDTSKKNYTKKVDAPPKLQMHEVGFKSISYVKDIDAWKVESWYFSIYQDRGTRSIPCSFLIPSDMFQEIRERTDGKKHTSIRLIGRQHSPLSAGLFGDHLLGKKHISATLLVHSASKRGVEGWKKWLKEERKKNTKPY